MLSLEQVKLLETKVVKAIEYVERVSGENAALLQKEADLQAKLQSYQKRIDELEVLVMKFKEDHGRIEDGILAALDRLNQFESAVEKNLKEKQAVRPAPVKSADAVKPAAPKASVQQTPPAAPVQPVQPEPAEMFFEIPETETEDDIADPLAEIDAPGEPDKNGGENGELEIF